MTTKLSVGAQLTDVAGMRAAIDEGRTTPAALVEGAIERAETVNPQLNFIAWSNFDRARLQASEQRNGLLGGIPTLIKDMIMEKGIPASWGAVALRDFIAQNDSPYTLAMANAGLISIARSTMPELGLNVVTDSRLIGPTRNPWSLDHTPGGSSGGSAAAVAAGVVPIAHASDGLGSIRHGAAPCGLVGLKPSRGRNIGDEALRTIADLNVNGCVSRTVRDTAMWLQATQTRQPDAAFRPVPFVSAPVESKLRIHAYSAVMRTGADPDASVARVFSDTIRLLGRLGHNIADGQLPFDAPTAVEALHAITEGVFARRLGLLSGQIGMEIGSDDLEYRSQTLVEQGRRIDDERYDAAWQHMEKNVSSYLGLLDDIDIWMTPTFSTEIVRVGIFGPDTAWLDQRDHLVDYAGYCWIDNFAGSPSISLPMGFSDNGLPVGIQFATKPGGEGLLLALAYQLENAVEWWRHKPPIWIGGDGNL